MKLPDMNLSNILRKPLPGLQNSLVRAVERRAKVKEVEIGRSRDPQFDYCMSVEKSINNKDYSCSEYAKAAATGIALLVPGLVSEIPDADSQQYWGTGSHSRYRGLIFLMATQVEKLANVLDLPQIEEEVAAASKAAINVRANASFINQTLSPCLPPIKFPDRERSSKVHEVIETAEGYEVILDPPVERYVGTEYWFEEPGQLKDMAEIETALCDKLGFAQEPGSKGYIDFKPGTTFQRKFVGYENYVQVVAERLEQAYKYGCTKIRIAGTKNKELIEKLFWDAVISAPCIDRDELEAEPGKRKDFRQHLNKN